MIRAGKIQTIDPRCRFSPITGDIFVLKYGTTWSTRVDVLEKDAKLLRATIFPQFTNLLVVEIFTGTAGTFAKCRSVRLYVFDLSRTNTDPLLERNIKETTTFLDQKSDRFETNVWEDSYRLESTLIGQPKIRWLKNSRTTVLDLKKEKNPRQRPGFGLQPP